MAHTHRIDTSRRVATLTFTGTVTGHDLVSALFALYEDPAWAPGYDAIWDFRVITELLLEEGDLKNLVALDHELDDVAGHGRDVVVVSRELDLFVGKLFLRLSKDTPRPNHLVTTMDEALVWLNGEAPSSGSAA